MTEEPIIISKEPLTEEEKKKLSEYSVLRNWPKDQHTPQEMNASKRRRLKNKLKKENQQRRRKKHGR